MTSTTSSDEPALIRVGDTGTFLTVSAAATLAGSVVHDWGFLVGLGLEFTLVPTTLADHTRSALIWMPPAMAALLIVGTYRLLLLRLPSKPIPPATTRAGRIGNAIWRNGPYFLFMLLLAWRVLAYGERLAGIVGVISFFAWVSFATWIAEYDLLRRLASPGIRATFVIAPAFSIMLFFFGWQTALNHHERPRELAVVTIDGASSSVGLMALYENGVLAKHANRIVFVRWDNVALLSHPERTDIWPGHRWLRFGPMADVPVPASPSQQGGQTPPN